MPPSAEERAGERDGSYLECEQVQAALLTFVATLQRVTLSLVIYV